jgi:DHA3 family tetracycline resistance protein-like MFS transporter
MRATAAFAFTMIITYELVYHTVSVGLTPIQLVTVGVVLETMTLLFEIPTGVVADAYSRRLSIITGLFLIGAGFLLEGLMPTFMAVLMAQVLWGIGFTFYSGAGEAWITDEIGQEQAGNAFLRGSQASQAASLAGIGAGTALANIALWLPILIGAILFFAIVIFLTITMSEEGFHPISGHPDPHILAEMIRPFREGVRLIRTHPTLMTILLIGFVIGSYGGGFDRLYAPYLVENFTLPRLGNVEPVTWFGILSGIIGLGTFVGIEAARRWLNLAQQSRVVRLLLVLYSGMIICTLVFALTDRIVVALIVYSVSQTLRQTSKPIFMVWINQNAASHVRATVISTYWQFNALGQIVSSPVIGWIGTVVSLRAALSVCVLFYGASIPLLLRAGRYASERVRESNP